MQCVYIWQNKNMQNTKNKQKLHREGNWRSWSEKENIYPDYHCISFDSLLQFALETSYWLLQQGFNRGYKQGKKMSYKGFCHSQVPLVSFVPLFLLVGQVYI